MQNFDIDKIQSFSDILNSNYCLGKEDIRALRKDFSRLKTKGKLTGASVRKSAVSLATAFINTNFLRGLYLRGAVELLCEIAALKNRKFSGIGRDIIFTLLTEGLCDSFKKPHALLYDKMFSQVIDFFRHLPSGKRLNESLDAFGIMNEKDMLSRKKRINRLRAFPDSHKSRVKKIFILSRITIGSDVAVTSVIIEKIKHIFKEAEVVFVASSKIEELFGADARIKICKIDYPRRGNVMDRLNIWVKVVNAIKREAKGLKAGEYAVIDPGSRLTQLGLLPVIKEEKGYYFFESRSYKERSAKCMAQLAADWADKALGGKRVKLYPHVNLKDREAGIGKSICQALYNGGARYIVSVNLGTGGNINKRISSAFEEKLLCGLINNGSTIILDKGSGEEAGRMGALAANLRKKGNAIMSLTDKNTARLLNNEKIKCDILTWEGGVGIFSSLIASSDMYIGYDSAFQHVAAALGVPTVVIFAGAPSDIFLKRWRSYGRGFVKVIKV